MTPSTADAVLAALQAYDLKPQSDGTFKANSPLRPGSNSHALHLTIIDGEHGAWKDFAGDDTDSGSLYELARVLGIEPGTKANAPTTKRTYSGLADYAQAHGVPIAAYQNAGWQEVTHQGRAALRFATAAGPRWRFLDGNAPTFTHNGGYSPCWYGLERAVQLAKSSDQPLVLCNGEASVVAAQHWGVAAACVTSSGERTLTPHALAELQEAFAGPVLVALDSDKKGRATTPKLVAQLQGASYEANGVDLNGHEGFDLADFCALHQGESVKALESHVVSSTLNETPETERRKLVLADDLGSLPPMRWLIPNELPVGGFAVLFGPSGTGKSFIALDYAHRVAETQTVVYIAAEGGAGYAKRCTAWRVHHGRTSSGKLHFYLDSVHMLTSADVEQFIATITPLSPALVIVDTLARCFIGGDENSAKDMGLFIAGCDRIRQATGACVLVAHHTDKSGSTERGSGALRGAADVMLELSGEADLIRLECSKTKDETPFEPRHLRRIDVGDTGSCVMVPTVATSTPTGKLGKGERAILELLALTIFDASGVKTTQIGSATKLGDSTLYRLLAGLKKRGYITQGSKGDPYYITIDGRDALESPESADSTPLANSHNDIPHSNAQLSPTLTNSHTTLAHSPNSLSLSLPFRAESERERGGEVEEVGKGMEEESDELWGNEPKQPQRTHQQAERQVKADESYNARIGELIRRACDARNWRKALTEAGRLRGDAIRRQWEAIIRQREQETRNDGFAAIEGY